MDTPDAMQTTFTGDGPTTHVLIPREIAETDLGLGAITADQFIAWIDTNNDRIYESARRKRAMAEGYEEVALEPGDLLTVEPLAPDTAADTDWDSAAEIRRIGSIVGTDPVEYSGTLKQAVAYAMEMEPAMRADFCVRTPDRIYDMPDIERLAERIGADG